MYNFSQTIYRTKLRTANIFSCQIENISTHSFTRYYHSTMTFFANKTNSHERAKNKKLWLIADMDETLVPKSMREFQSSPVWNPLLLKLKDKRVHLVIVTSDDAYRPFLIWDQLLGRADGVFNNGEANKIDLTESDLSNRIWVSTSQGCGFFQRDKLGNTEQVYGYPKLSLDRTKTIELSQHIWLKYLREVRPWSNKLVLEKYPHWASNYRKIYWRMHRTLIKDECKSSKEGGLSSFLEDEDDPPPVDAYHDENTLKDYPKTIADLNLTEEDLLTPGLFFRSGILWVAKLGPACYNEKFDLKKDPWGSAWLMHCPRPWSEEILATIDWNNTCKNSEEVDHVLSSTNSLETVQASAAPRSICFTCNSAEKSRTVDFLVKSGMINVENSGIDEGIRRDVEDAVILIGDQPYGNDAALRALGDQGQFPFIAVTCVEDTAKFLDKLDVNKAVEAETQTVFVNYLKNIITEVSPPCIQLYFSEAKAMS